MDVNLNHWSYWNYVDFGFHILHTKASPNPFRSGTGVKISLTNTFKTFCEKFNHVGEKGSTKDENSNVISEITCEVSWILVNLRMMSFYVKFHEVVKEGRKKGQKERFLEPKYWKDLLKTQVRFDRKLFMIDSLIKANLY